MAEARKQQKVLPSDDRAYDDLLPSHPLSRVRKVQAEILATLALMDGVAESG
jgi:hypothetical protein